MTRTTLIAATAALTLLVPGRELAAQSATVIFEWNQIIQDTIPGGGGAGAPRFYALAHIAMFDAVNGIHRDFEPYRVKLGGGSGAPEAAAAQAAHDVLVALNPSATAAYDALLRQHLGDRPTDANRRGAKVGAHVAAAVLAWRQDDGWIVPSFPAYAEPPLPGRWQPTGGPATFTHVGQAKPLAMVSPTHFLPAPPPSLTSDRYAVDVNEVKAVGRIDSATRTPLQTEIARLWANIAVTGTGTATTYSAVWNTIAQNLARDRGLTLVEAARLFVLMNVSIHDSLHTTLTSKFVYGLWRPVTAIRQADTDLNPATEADPSWATLIPTPPYPSYAGNMATIGAGAARALALAIGTNDVAVTATWRQSGGLPDVTHHFATLWDVAQEQADSRIYGGIHYRFDNEAGQVAGRAVAEYVFANFMRPK
jgi:hypothetical protein